MSYLKKNIIFFITIIISFTCYAYKDGPEAQFKKSYQITWLYPIGTDFFVSSEYKYKYSWNLLVGYTGGVEKFELATIGNINKYSSGKYSSSEKHFALQFAGLFNNTNGNFRGIQFSGIFNYTAGSFGGLQLGAMYNYIGEELEGFQFSTLMNYCESGGGIQSTFGINATESEFGGHQYAGLMNDNISFSGLQIAGLFNNNIICTGIQIAGIVNLNKETNADYKKFGIDKNNNNIGGFAGLQLAGIMNINEFGKGVQIAGLINIIGEMKTGIAIAPINIILKNGYMSSSVFSTEFAPAAINLKTGMRYFYNIVTFSYDYDDDSKNNTIYGGGFGIEQEIGKRSAVNYELTLVNFCNNFVNNDLALVNSFNVMYNLYLFKHLSIFAGPSLNMLYTDNKDKAEEVAPSWALIGDEHSYWVGYHAGIQMHF